GRLPGAPGRGAGGAGPPHGRQGPPRAAQGDAGAHERAGAAHRSPGAGRYARRGDVQRRRGSGPAGRHRAAGRVAPAAPPAAKAGPGRAAGLDGLGKTLTTGAGPQGAALFCTRTERGKAMLEGLQQYAAQIGVPLSDEQAQAMRTYWAAVLETNRHTNLTRITDDKEATLKHFIDSLSVLPTGVFGPGARVADVGTGAGFPGVPLKIARPDLQLVLIDSTLKRVRFLRSVIRLLGWDDVEALAADPKGAGTFGLVVARAVAKLDALANWCLPLLRPGGRLVAMKGPDVAEELKEAAGALAAGGGRLVKVERLALPEGAGRRSIVIVERTGAG